MRPATPSQIASWLRAIADQLDKAEPASTVDYRRNP